MEPNDEQIEDEGIHFETGQPIWERRVSRRGKLARIVAPALVCLVVLLALLARIGAFDGVVSALPPSHSALASAPTLRGVQERSLGMPRGGAETPASEMTPSNDPQHPGYACWASQPNIPAMASASLYFASLDAKGVWTLHQPPALAAAGCVVIPDTSASGGVLLATYEQNDDDTSSGLSKLFLSRDAGTTWATVPYPPALRLHPASFALTGGHVYAWASSALLPADQRGAGAGGRCIESSDAGQTWRAADSGLAAYQSFRLIGARPGGHLLAQTGAQESAMDGVLWGSDDDGATWRSLGPLPGAEPLVFVSSNPNETAQGGWGRLYLQGQSEINGKPDNAAVPFLATSYPGQGWTPLPATPSVDQRAATANDPRFPTHLVIGVGSGDMLLVAENRPSSNAGEYTPRRALWAWRPQKGGGQWLRAPFEMPPNNLPQGIGWQGSVATFWFTTLLQKPLLPMNLSAVTFAL